MSFIAATGGTFDIIHKGHEALLSVALQYDSTIIGLCSDGFVIRRDKHVVNNYDTRLHNLTCFIRDKFPTTTCVISRLDDDFGPSVLEPSVHVLVCSEETAHMGDVLNDMRARRGLAAVDVVIVPMVSGSDGTRISTTKIRDGIMDENGNKILSCG